MKKHTLLVSTLFCLLSFQPPRKMTVYSIGDSTMANIPLKNNTPARGWMQMMPSFFTGAVTVHNYGRSGRSSKSFRSEGWWAKVISQVRPGDYVFIQFGHNDEKPDTARHTDPETSFRHNMTRYVQETREKGGLPILFTSITRRDFDSTGHLLDTHGAYVTVVRDLAKTLKVPLVDLNEMTTRLVESKGPEESKKMYLFVSPGVTAAFPDGRKDNTHLCIYGATEVARLAAEGIHALHIPLSGHVKLK